MKRSIHEGFLLTAALVLVSVVNAAGQVSTPVPVPAKAPAPTAVPRTSVSPVVVESSAVAPQVVTIVHRLNGIKFLRLLRRASGEKNTVANLNDAFNIGDEVHTNILAGLALDDGRTIAAWLPQAEAELESSFFFPNGAMPPIPPGAPDPGQTARGVPAPLPPGSSHLSVVARDGKELRARFVGLDGHTGISVLRISGLGFAIPAGETETAVVMGQRLRLFAPEGAPSKAAVEAGRVYVRVGESEAKVASIHRVASGTIDRLVAHATKLSPAVVGGIAIDDAGVTVGIVESVTETDVSILPLAAIRQAAKRVIERQASVPRPLLGIRGEGIGFVPREQMMLKGWPMAEATALLDKRQGIMLTAVAPGTPAALARLRPGDVILRINEKDITSAQDFSALIAQCEAEIPVRFTVVRPDHAIPEAITVKLADALNFQFKMEFEFPQPIMPRIRAMSGNRVVRAVAPDPLAGLGIETLAFAPRAAARLRAQSGLVVVSVNPEGIGYRNGVREGDVIETIDNRLITERKPGTLAPAQFSQTLVLGIVRNGQKSQITIQRHNEKKD
jgi:S1-C subfamily serine protease